MILETNENVSHSNVNSKSVVSSAETQLGENMLLMKYIISKRIYSYSNTGNRFRKILADIRMKKSVVYCVS